MGFRKIAEMIKLLRTYVLIHPSVLSMIGGIFFLQMINTSFFLILNLYLRKAGYSDADIASFVSFRFMGTLVLAFPMGLFIRGRKLKPWFLSAGLGLPFISLIILELLHRNQLDLANIFLLIWGVLFMFIQVCALPFILRNTRSLLQSEAITLSYSMYSLGQIFSGMLIAFLIHESSWVMGGFALQFTELNILRIISVLGFFSFAFMMVTHEPPLQGEGRLSWKRFRYDIFQYDWRLIMITLIPTFLLSVGAGLTIPFINLFFNSVFGMDSDTFSEMGAIAAVLVFGGAALVPYIKRTFGFEIAITLSQSLAVFFLVLMALTELFPEIPSMVWIAGICFLIRQPLMNMAAPMTSELTMLFVGEKNRELMSALIASIWSGSYVISAKIFQLLRAANTPYYQVLLITALLYAIGVVAYYMIIRGNRRKQKYLSLRKTRTH